MPLLKFIGTTVVVFVEKQLSVATTYIVQIIKNTWTK
jgi:hypothetical protein